MTICSTSNAFQCPVGKNPPSFHRLATEGPCSGPNPAIGRRMPRPMMIMPKMVTILMLENQNSARPNTPTEIRLAQNRTPSETSAVNQTGITGHQ